MRKYNKLKLDMKVWASIQVNIIFSDIVSDFASSVKWGIVSETAEVIN